MQSAKTRKLNENSPNVVFMVLYVAYHGCTKCVCVCVRMSMCRENERVNESQRKRERMWCDVLVHWGGLEFCLMSQTKFWLDWAEMNKWRENGPNQMNHRLNWVSAVNCASSREQKDSFLNFSLRCRTDLWNNAWTHPNEILWKKLKLILSLFNNITDSE